MRNHFAAWIVFASTLIACSKHSPEPAKVHANVATTAEANRTPNVPGPAPEGHGTRRIRGIDLPVFVDGQQAAVLRYGDLPPIANVGSEFAPVFRLTDYLAAIGVSPATVRGVFVYDGSNRIASIGAKEFAKEPARFTFRFASGTTGIAETAWDTVGLENSFIVHEIRQMAVFTRSAPPALDKNRQCVLLPSGECNGDVPEQAGAPTKGTRIYVDGKMAGSVKRRNVGDALAMGSTADGQEKYSLAKLIGTFGVDMSGVTAVEMVAGDDVIARADGVLWAHHQGSATFTLAKHQHGKVRVQVPADMQAAEAGSAADERAASVTSVLLYKSTRPGAGRPLVAISDATDLSAQLAANDEPREGSSKAEDDKN
jgi:hypothetical protein